MIIFNVYRVRVNINAMNTLKPGSNPSKMSASPMSHAEEHMETFYLATLKVR